MASPIVVLGATSGSGSGAAIRPSRMARKLDGLAAGLVDGIVFGDGGAISATAPAADTHHSM